MLMFGRFLFSPVPSTYVSALLPVRILVSNIVIFKLYSGVQRASKALKSANEKCCASS